jgi:hypothetical protein
MAAFAEYLPSGAKDRLPPSNGRLSVDSGGRSPGIDARLNLTWSALRRSAVLNDSKQSVFQKKVSVGRKTVCLGPMLDLPGFAAVDHGVVAPV